MYIDCTGEGDKMETKYEKLYGNDMDGLELLEDAIYTSERCEADPCQNCGACELYEAEFCGD
jgi:hypothetical protein